MRQFYAEAPKKTEAHKIVKAMRIYLGMTQAEAAKKVGISLDAYVNYENIPGRILRGHFSTVFRILEVMHLNPKKFIQGQYELNEAGRKITSWGTGPINHIMRKALRDCPVMLKSRKED